MGWWVAASPDDIDRCRKAGELTRQLADDEHVFSLGDTPIVDPPGSIRPGPRRPRLRPRTGQWPAGAGTTEIPA